jgi:citrate lyase subunit beta/citryl-CoA lyase
MKPIRTALFAPGIKERVMTKALESATDAVILDLEDSTPLALKTEARVCVAKTIESVAAANSERPYPAVFVRVNASSTGLQADDLAAVVRPGLNAIMIPKINKVEEVREIASALDRYETENKMRSGTVEIILFFETALGVNRCFDLINASSRVAATCFGSAQDGDLQADLGCGWSIEGPELLYARSKVLLDTRAAGSHIVPLDGVFSNLNDETALVQDSRLSARLGYVGRTIIHPKQIAPVRQAYAVSETDATYYRKVVREFEAVEKAGTAAITVDGKLVDYAMYERARRVVELAKLDS